MPLPAPSWLKAPPPPCGALSRPLGFIVSDLRRMGFLDATDAVKGRKRPRPPKPWRRVCVCELGHAGEWHRSEDGQVWHRDDSVTREQAAEEEERLRIVREADETAMLVADGWIGVDAAAVASVGTCDGEEHRPRPPIRHATRADQPEPPDRAVDSAEQQQREVHEPAARVRPAARFAGQCCPSRRGLPLGPGLGTASRRGWTTPPSITGGSLTGPCTSCARSAGECGTASRTVCGGGSGGLSGVQGRGRGDERLSTVTALWFLAVTPWIFAALWLLRPLHPESRRCAQEAREARQEADKIREKQAGLASLGPTENLAARMERRAEMWDWRYGVVRKFRRVSV